MGKPYVIANTVDHVHPISEGGPAFPGHDGLCSYCGPCHSAKTARGTEAGAVRASRPRKGCDANGNPLDPVHPWRKRSENATAGTRLEFDGDASHPAAHPDGYAYPARLDGATAASFLKQSLRGAEAGALRSSKPRRGCDEHGNPLDSSHPWAHGARHGKTTEKNGAWGKADGLAHSVAGDSVRDHLDVRSAVRGLEESLRAGARGPLGDTKTQLVSKGRRNGQARTRCNETARSCKSGSCGCA